MADPLTSVPGERVPLGRWPVPVQACAALCPDVDAPLYVKREDLAGGAYGGNKVRKLERILATLPEGAPVLTVGAAGSHHVVATAWYAGRHGHPVWAILGPQPGTDHARTHARISLGLLAGYRSIGGWASLPLALARCEADIRRQHGRAPVFVPPGGSSVHGVLGSATLGLELVGDVAAGRLPAPDRVYVALGSGGTAVGLWVGLRAAGLDTEVVGVRVTDRYMVPMPRLRSMARKAVGRLQKPLALPLGVRPLRVVHDQFGGGYGVPTAAGEDARSLAAARACLDLEPTYTAKALAGCLAELRAGKALGVTVFIDTVNSRPLDPLLSTAPDALPDDIEGLLGPG